jgi:predicted  nucleic acid-binding Zn-ribbon protein
VTETKNPTRVLVALQDLEQMIREAEDPASRAELEKLGFPVTGLDGLRTAQAKLEKQIKPQLLTRYRRLVDRCAGRAVVPVVDGFCTGCFTNIPTSFTSVVHSGKVLTCETCGRMLFWP